MTPPVSGFEPQGVQIDGLQLDRVSPHLESREIENGIDLPKERPAGLADQALDEVAIERSPRGDSGAELLSLTCHYDSGDSGAGRSLSPQLSWVNRSKHASFSLKRCTTSRRRVSSELLGTSRC